MNKNHIQKGLFLNGQWLYKLACPFNSLPYYPVDSKTMADILQISQRTALRVCKGERALSLSELLLLQFKIFGYIDDKSFSRAGFYIVNGVMFCHKAPNYELGAGEILEFALLASYYKNAVLELSETKKRLAEFENPKPPEPTNIINFADFKR